MTAPIDAQLFQVHTAFAAMMPDLLRALAEHGALPQAAARIAGNAILLLQGAPAEGEAVDAAIQGLSELLVDLRRG